ncbi:MAG: N-acetylmuramoyl-L-alanine amidase [Herpetosiphonaceae bacterium]|nr:N-acetylmuramoyl-L-alanine amidase [Herpetosiphonaceae bacterium]
MVRSMGLAALVAGVLTVTGVHGQTSAPLSGIMVVVDAGHGGDDEGVDPGSSRLNEKVLTLDLAQRLARQLQAQGARVFMTRRTDRFVSLGARVRFTNVLLFRPDNAADQGRSISLHFNSNLLHPNLTRVEVLVDPMAPADPFAVQLAQELAQTTGGGFGYSDAGYPPGVHPADVAPVRWTFPRAANVLSESAFLSNGSQAKQLRDTGWLEALAAAHVRALRRTLQR